MVRFYSCDFRNDQELDSYSSPRHWEQNRPHAENSMLCGNSSTSSIQARCKVEEGCSKSFLSSWILSLSSLIGSSKQESMTFCKWLLMLSTAGKDTRCWGKRAKSYPSLEHFPGPVPNPPQGHHHPLCGTGTSATFNITCLGSGQDFFKGWYGGFPK